MHVLNPGKVALSFGATLGGFHLIWSFLVALGWAQNLLNFIFKLHMIEPMYVVMPFSLTSSALLIVVTAVIGSIVGYVFATLWNLFHK